MCKSNQTKQTINHPIILDVGPFLGEILERAQLQSPTNRFNNAIHPMLLSAQYQPPVPVE